MCKIMDYEIPEDMEWFKAKYHEKISESGRKYIDKAFNIACELVDKEIKEGWRGLKLRNRLKRRLREMAIKVKWQDYKSLRKLVIMMYNDIREYLRERQAKARLEK